MVALIDSLLVELRRVRRQHLMVEAADQLNPRQRATAFAVAVEIMRSDGPLQDDERNILTSIATTLDLHEADTAKTIKGVILTHSETSTGMINDLQTIAKHVRAHGTALTIADCVTSLGATDVPMDD
jgi:hypothetical protein